MKPWVVSKTLIFPFSVVCTLQTSPGSFSRSKFQSPWKECFFKSTNGCNGTAQSIAFTSLVWVPVEKYYEHTKTWHVPKAPTRHWQPVTQSVLPFVPEKKPTTQREDLHQWFANLRGTAPVHGWESVIIFSSSQFKWVAPRFVVSPYELLAFWNSLFRLPRSWDANQGLRGHAMVSCTRAFVGVHPLWQGLWSTGERVDEWWWMFFLS